MEWQVPRAFVVFHPGGEVYAQGLDPGLGFNPCFLEGSDLVAFNVEFGAVTGPSTFVPVCGGFACGRVYVTSAK